MVKLRSRKKSQIKKGHKECMLVDNFVWYDEEERLCQTYARCSRHARHSRSNICERSIRCGRAPQ